MTNQQHPITPMTNPDYRAMCAELVRRWDAANGDHDLLDVADAMDRARALLAQPPADGELTVNLRMDLSSECLKRLCNGLAAAVKPSSGYRALTTNDDKSGEFIGAQQVGVEWWLPEHGCDSLENTLDSIKGRLLAAVQDWLPTAVTSTPQPPADGLPANALPTPETNV